MKLPTIVFVMVLTVPATSYAERCQNNGYPIQPAPGYQHDKWVSSAEDGDIRYEFGGFVASYDGSDAELGAIKVLSQPEWVAHEVRRFKNSQGHFEYVAGFERPRPWYELKDMATGVVTQSGVNDTELDKSYAGEGAIWNRGHMATRSLVNRLGPEAGCNSHTFANAIPQYWSTNQGEWNALERYTGALANKYGKAWAINGPVFFDDHRIETIGENNEVKIPIPHAVFKVIIWQVDDDIYVRAFLFHQPTYRSVKRRMRASGGRKPNMGFRSCRATHQEDYDFSNYTSSIAEIESLTRIVFFPDASDEEKDSLNGYSSRGIVPVALRFFPKPCEPEQ